MTGIKNNTHEDDDSETTGREQQVDPGLDLRVLDVEAGGDDTSFVKTSVELDDNLARAVVVDDLEFTDIS
jgi:hypothetical protein